MLLLHASANLYVPIRDVGRHLKELNRFHQLRMLDLSVANIGDDDLEHIQGLSQLRKADAQQHQGHGRRAGVPQGADPTPMVGP